MARDELAQTATRQARHHGPRPAISWRSYSVVLPKEALHAMWTSAAPRSWQGLCAHRWTCVGSVSSFRHRLRLEQPNTSS